jgi:ATP phosphoribosyltransferase regulatory subunit
MNPLPAKSLAAGFSVSATVKRNLSCKMFEPLSKIPDGLRYYFGAEARLRRHLEDTAMSVFGGWSYQEITTPSIDYFALFERGMGPEHARRAFRFTDRDGRLLALRPDVTSLVARAAATLINEEQRPLRLCYAASVFRQQPQSHAEWRRESVQLGCEFIGPGSALAEMEMLAIAAEVLERMNLGGHYRITLNNVEFFNGIAESLELDAPRRERMRHLTDVRDSAELRRFLASFAASTADCAAFSRLTQLTGQREIFTEARRIITNQRSLAALHSLESLWGIIQAMGLTDSFEIDLGDVSGLDYYTGLTFKIYVAGAGSRIGSGGRYDCLTANFGKAEPAVGFVLDLDAMTDVLMRKGKTALADTTLDAATQLASHDPAALFRAARAKRLKNERVILEIKNEE